MNTRALIALCAVLGLEFVRLVAQTDVISINLGGNSDQPRPDPKDVVGFVQAAGWVNLFGKPDLGGAPLPFENGEQSGATITTQDAKGNRTTRVALDAANANTKMFNRGLGLRAVSETIFTLTGVPTTGAWAGGFEVYVYFAPDAGMPRYETQGFTLACGDVVYHCKLNMNAPNYTGQFVRLESVDPKAPGDGNYVVFTGLTGNTVTIRGKTDQAPNAILITGLQIFARPAAATK